MIYEIDWYAEIFLKVRIENILGIVGVLEE